MIKHKKQFDKFFDDFAYNYDKARPGYPNKMYNNIKKECSLSNKSKILEVGAGSGIATVKLARYESKITALEPGKNLSAIIKRKTKSFSNVKIVETTFENFNSTQKFDCIIFFTSFHWMDEKNKYKKINSLLTKNGCLIVVWNSFLQSEEVVTRKVNSLYKRDLSDLHSARYRDINYKVLNKLNNRVKELVQSELFYLQFFKKYININKYNSNKYSMLLKTFPNIIKIEKKRRDVFLQNVETVVKKYKIISVPTLTTLLIVRKKSS